MSEAAGQNTSGIAEPGTSDTMEPVNENQGTQNADGSTESLEQTLAAVEGTGKDLNAVTAVMGDRARTLARKSADRHAAGETARTLEGIPFAIKDVIDVAGYPTTMGSQVSSGPDPSITAPVVSLLEKAGALPVAKTNCQEYSYGILGDESAFGRVVNPIDPTLCTAGSSSGSAALVAAGVVPLALGTDTAGSVRVPAACQGVIGFKPTFGSWSTDGVFPLSPSFDTVGLLARDLPLLISANAAITWNNSGPDRAGSTRAETVTLDLGLLDSADDSAAAARTWAERNLSGARVAPRKSEELTKILSRCIRIYDIVRRHEAYVLHEQYLDDQGEWYQPGVWAKIMSGQAITEAEYQAEIASLVELRTSALKIFDDVDFIITPAIEGDVIRWDQVSPDMATRFMRYAMPFNVLGWPAVTLPIGAVASGQKPERTSGSKPGSKSGSKSGSKLGAVQIVGAPHSDQWLLEFIAGL